MTEATGYGYEMIHRLLVSAEIQKKKEMSMDFKKSRQSTGNRCWIIDEMSMVDLTLMHALTVVPEQDWILWGCQSAAASV